MDILLQFITTRMPLFRIYRTASYTMQSVVEILHLILQSLLRYYPRIEYQTMVYYQRLEPPRNAAVQLQRFELAEFRHGMYQWRSVLYLYDS
jgi:hypothetical protein